jgi:hypothetical protein
MSGYSDEMPGKSAGVDAELQEFLMMEKQKAQVNAQVSSWSLEKTTFASILTYVTISLPSRGRF